jgi:hypothetical protein
VHEAIDEFAVALLAIAIAAAAAFSFTRHLVDPLGKNAARSGRRRFASVCFC